MNHQRPWLRLFGRCSRTAGSACLTSVCWLLWIALTASLILLATVQFRHELTVPDFLLRRIEQKLEFAQISARFGRTAFDPSGNIVLEDVRLYAAGLPEPLARAAAVRLHLDLWAVLSGDFDVKEVELTDVQLDCPAIVSPSGTSEPIVRDLGVTIRRERDQWEVPQAFFHAGQVLVTAQVRWQLAAAAGPRRQLPADLLKSYYALARRAIEALQQTERLENAHLNLSVEGSLGAPPRLHAELVAGHASLPGDLAAEDLRLLVDTAWRPGGLDPATVTIEAGRLLAPHDLAVTHAWMHTGGHLEFQPFKWIGGPVNFSAAAITRGEDLVAHPRATVWFDSLPRWRAELAALAEGTSPLALSARIDPSAKTANVEFASTAAPDLLNEAAARAAVWRKSRILAQLRFAEPVEFAGHATLAPGWKLEQATARARLGAMVGYGVDITSITAEMTVDPQRLLVTPIVLHRPAADVTGSYEMDLKTQDYRFLLQGHFFPEDISPWLGKGWQRFWNDFQFGKRGPDADVDILGRWRSPERNIVYGWADVAPVTLRGVPLDHVRSTFFIRSEHYDIISFDARRGSLQAVGGFTRHDDPATHTPQWINFDFRSTLPLHEGARLFGAEGARTVEPFVFDEPPTIAAAGRMEWTPTGIRDDIHASAAAPGVFRFHGFPVDNARFAFDLKAGEIFVREIAGEIAGGKLTGSATVTGPQKARQLAFEGQLLAANLSRTVKTWADYRALTAVPGTPPLPDSAAKLGEKGQIDLKLEASGPLENLFALQGQGTATVRGAELANIEMFGVLSRLLRGTFLGFTSLEFNDADAQFAINGEHLDFSTLKLTGPFAALKGKGRYTMPPSTLSFNVVVYPFRESNSPIYMFVGTVLTPFSHAFGIHLGGTLAKPEGTLSFGAGDPYASAPATQPEPTPRTEETKPASAH